MTAQGILNVIDDYRVKCLIEWEAAKADKQWADAAGWEERATAARELVESLSSLIDAEAAVHP
ncbi:hypothetical protein KGP36_04110 [Patescibacteria group bacterium]|nr:hypothetical protein [Patescibacteria group bacterium]